MKKKNKGGRPTTYNEDIGIKICSRIVEGEILVDIVKDEGMPSVASFYKWLPAQPELSKLYAHAKADKAEAYFDEMIGISDGVGLSIEEIKKAELQIKTRQYACSKLKPNKYGDKGITINTQINNLHEKYVLNQYDTKEIDISSNKNK